MGALLRRRRDVLGLGPPWLRCGFHRSGGPRLRHAWGRFSAQPRSAWRLPEHRHEPALWRHRFPRGPVALTPGDAEVPAPRDDADRVGAWSARAAGAPAMGGRQTRGADNVWRSVLGAD